MKVLMCKPSYYAIEYEINPWMHLNINVDPISAMAQWGHLCATLQNCGVDIKYIEPQSRLPDMVFTANAGLVHNQDVLLAQAKYPQRQGERFYYRSWFAKNGYHIIEETADTTHVSFEGEGEALRAGKKYFVSYGIRSDKNYYKNFAKLGIKEIVYCELIDPQFYHLDTCFCPLNATQALYWPQAFTTETQDKLNKHLELFAVPEVEAKRFACNAIVLGKKIIIPSGSPETNSLLKKLGFTVYACDMSEFFKSGGACKCMVLFI